MSSSSISSELAETSRAIYHLERSGQKWSSWKSCSQNKSYHPHGDKVKQLNYAQKHRNWAEEERQQAELSSTNYDGMALMHPWSQHYRVCPGLLKETEGSEEVYIHKRSGVGSTKPLEQTPGWVPSKTVSLEELVPSWKQRVDTPDIVFDLDFPAHLIQFIRWKETIGAWNFGMSELAFSSWP